MTKKKIKEETSVATQENNLAAVNSTSAAVGFFGNQFAMWTSLPIEDKIAVAQAMGDANYNIREYFKGDQAEPIEVVHALAHVVDVLTEENELVKANRIVLIDKNGKTYSSVAEGVKTSLGNIFALFGLPPFNPPLKIKAEEVLTRRKRYTLNLKPVE
jgi:hypothetical protein